MRVPEFAVNATNVYRTENYIVKSIEENRIKREIKLKESLESGDGSNDIKRYGENRKRYLQFLDNVKPQKEGGGVFNGKKVSISVNYEEHHFRQNFEENEFVKIYDNSEFIYREYM